MSKEEWEAEGKTRFGDNQMKWKFICPSCGNVASVEDYKNAGAPSGAVGFSCIGRWTGATQEAFAGSKGKKPCNYAGGGLIGINPVHIDGVGDYFDFAPSDKI